MQRTFFPNGTEPDEAMTDEKRYEIVTSYLKARVAEMIDEMRA
jgi:hypothetical protein